MLLIVPKIWFKRTGKVWFYLLLCCLPFGALAQDEDEGVVDTTFVDSAATMSAPEEVVDEEQVETHATTAPELREVPDSVVSGLKKDEQFEYANDPVYWEKEKDKEEKASRSGSGTYRKGFWEYFYDFFSNDGVRTVIYIILGVALVLLLYRIIIVNNLFQTNASRRGAQDEADAEVADIEDTDLDKKIRAAIQAKQFRPAIRLAYIKTLQALNEKGWIRYHAQSTNYEYIRQVQPHGAGSEFRFITHVYEYVWYGEFALSEEQFAKAYQHFQQFYNTINA